MTGQEASPRRFAPSFLIRLSAHALGVSLVWISFGSILLPLQVQQVAPPERQGILLGSITGLAIAVGLVANILTGILSDRTTSRLGRRGPAMLVGACLGVPAILAGAFLPLSVPLVFGAFLAIQVATNISAGANQPLLADLVPREQRGAASGFVGLSTLLGAALGFGLVTALAGVGRQGLALGLIACVYLGCTAITAWTIRPYDGPLAVGQPAGLRRALRDMVQVRPGTGGFFWFVFGSLLLNVGVASFQVYGLFYLQTVIGLVDPLRGLQITGLLNLLVSMVVALIAGWASDRLGRRPVLVAAAAVAGMCSLAFPHLRSFALFLGVAAVYASTNGVVLSVARALASDLVPPDEAGKYMGYNNLASGLAQAMAAPMFGAILNLWGAPSARSFALLFGVVAACYGGSALVLRLKVPASARD